MSTPHPAFFVDPVKQYALDVVEGRELAGPFVRLACKRHLDDLEKQTERGIIWDWIKAKHALDFFPQVLTVTVNNLVVPFDLHASQVFIVGSIFGWYTPDGGRRYRVAYIEEAKGNGKSPLAAGIGLYMLIADKEYRAEIYSAAVDKDQAKVLFDDAVNMVDSSPQLKPRVLMSGGKSGDLKRVWNLAYIKTHSFFRPLASESQGRGKSGPRPHCAILDEVHEHPTNAMVEFMRAGTKGRTRALILMITNSGVIDPTAVCYEYHTYADRVLSGLESNEHFFAYVCALDEGDEWTDESVWKKTNPLLGISVTHEYLRERVQDALGMPSKISLTRRLNFCEWVDSSSPLFDAETWKANGDTIDIESLRGRSCVGAIDAAGKNDLFSITLLFDPDENGKRAVVPFFWTPEDTIKQRSLRDKAPYDQWVERGLIIATPGKTIDYDFVATKMGELAETYDVRAYAFDRWRIDELEKCLDRVGQAHINTDVERATIKLVPHAQGFQDMNPSIEALEDYGTNHTLAHGMHPVLTWCVNNVKVVQNPDLLRKFEKRLSRGRIDGAQTLCMAAGLSVSFPTDDGASYGVTEID